MQIARIILGVSDLDRAVAFWSGTVGLIVASGDGPFVFLDGGGVQLVLTQADGSVTDDSLTEIVIEADDVLATHNQMLGRGVPFEVELRPVTSDDRRDLLAAHFRDPDGHVVSLTGWVDRS